MKYAAAGTQSDDNSAVALHRFPPEDQLLICCARVNLTPKDQDQLRAIVASRLNWDAVMRETRRQCITPLMYRHLHAQCPDSVPPEVMTRLRQEYLLSATRSMALAAELREITLLLEGEGIASLPYKGPVLALQAYNDIALRTFTDLDLIVCRGDVARAREVLSSRGYAPLDQLTLSQETAVLRLDHNLPLVRSVDKIVIELHWRVAPVAFTFPMPMDLLWDRATPVLLGGKEVLGMSVNDLILVLSVHGARHAWSAIEWITGIAELIRQPDGVCWDQVIREAEQFRVGRIVRLALALADCLLDAPIPPKVACWVKEDHRIPRLVAWVSARLFVPVDPQTATEQWAAFQFELAVKDGPREQIRDGLRRILLPTGKDWGAAGLPDALFPIYYLIRPFRLLGRYLSHVAASRKETR